MEFDAIGSWRWSTIDRSTESETTPWPPAGSCGQWRPTWGADDEEMAHLYQVGLLTQRAHGLIPSESNLRCSPKLCFGTEMTPPPDSWLLRCDRLSKVHQSIRTSRSPSSIERPLHKVRRPIRKPGTTRYQVRSHRVYRVFRSILSHLHSHSSVQPSADWDKKLGKTR